MYTRWTSHLNTVEDKEKFKNEIYSAKSVLERLQAILEEDERGLNYSEIHPETYSKPNWQYHQAHKNGMRQYIYQIKTLINLDHQKGSINDDRS